MSGLNVVCILLLAAGCLSACGQSGGLYLPDQPTTTAVHAS